MFRTTKVFNRNTCKTASSNCGFKARSGSTTTAAAEEISEAVFALETRISSISLAPLPNAFGVFAAALMNDYEQIDVMQCKTKGFKIIIKTNWIFILSQYASNLTSKLKDRSYLQRLFWEPEKGMNVSTTMAKK